MRKKELKSLLNEAFYAPDPKNKQAFLKNIRPREVSLPSMLVQQLAYIRFSVWLFAAAVLIIVVAGSAFHFEETEKLMTALMPFTAAISVLETHRSNRYGMSEIERVTRFSLRSVNFARMTILGIISVILLGVSAPLIAYSFGEKKIMTALRIIIPYLVAMILGLISERSAYGRKNGYLSLGIASVIAVFNFWIDSFRPEAVQVYIRILETKGVLIAIILLLVTIFEQWKTINNVEAFA